ncbi:MAG: aminotransferase class I/II-fold pyridoxal phosphate-dependent enzyme, partial [Muribaculaceae bacterium]|nr:aminotransferase class I/II-fold pyridoxal phosphate-dependent enzyme [Muribaculaceae bacterium]
MFKVNTNFLKLNESYLFSEIARKIEAFKASHPDADIIRMGIGDVTRPLAPAVVNALQKAVAEQADVATFKGYGPEQGYAFLREAVAENDYKKRGIDISPDEIFISDGAKSDTANITDILGNDNVVALTDPVYPVYLDSNIMAGRAGEKTASGAYSRIVYLPCTEANNFVPQLPQGKVDIIYLCYPNNPTGTTLDRQQLKVWVDYARCNGALIM